MNSEKDIQILDNIVAIQCSNGNWDYDAYMHGMANGLLLAQSVIKGNNPEFLDAPEHWLADDGDSKNLRQQPERLK